MGRSRLRGGSAKKGDGTRGGWCESGSAQEGSKESAAGRRVGQRCWWCWVEMEEVAGAKSWSCRGLYRPLVGGKEAKVEEGMEGAFRRPRCQTRWGLRTSVCRLNTARRLLRGVFVVKTWHAERRHLPVSAFAREQPQSR